MIRVNGLALGIVGGLVGLGLRWAGYDGLVNTIATVGMFAFVAIIVYQRVHHSS